MKILFLTNNFVSEGLLKRLDNIESEIEVSGEKITEQYVIERKLDIIISYNYKHIIKEDVLRLMPGRILNLHISLLPWNRGAYPNLWSFLEDTPKGVTVHLVDRDIDTGDILLQRKVEIDEEKETLNSSYRLLHKEMQDMLISNWEAIRKDALVPVPQPPGGSVHYVKDFERIRHILGEEGWDISIAELKRRYNELKAK
jgi:methionyl-tRNA formyltransferase